MPLFIAGVTGTFCSASSRHHARSNRALYLHNSCENSRPDLHKCRNRGSVSVLLMKGVLKTADGKRPHPHRNRRNRKEAPKGRGCETLAGMRGSRPSAIQKRLETGSGSFRASSCRTSDRSACLYLAGLGAFARGPEFPVAQRGFPAAQWTKGAQASAILNRASPHLLNEDWRNPKRRQAATPHLIQRSDVKHRVSKDAIRAMGS